MAFQLKTTGGSAGSKNDGVFTHHGNVTRDGQKVLVYGIKEPDEDRAPQTRRSLNQTTFEQMIRGKLGIGEPGVDALTPFEGRKAINIDNFHEDDSPYQADFCAAAKTVLDEAQEADIEIPEWLEAAAEVEVEA